MLNANKKEGTLSGADRDAELLAAASNSDAVNLPETLTAAQINENNREFWKQQTPAGAKELNTNPPPRG